MDYRSINVSISPRHILPWIRQQVQVDGQAMFYISRRLSISSLTTNIYDTDSSDPIVKIHRDSLRRRVYSIETADQYFTVRKLSYWQWECRGEEETIMINRLGGFKCVLSDSGRQTALIALGSSLPLCNDRHTHIKVNDRKYLFLAIAASLILKSQGLDITPLLLKSNKLNPIRTVEFAR